jgi:hypothetical protein
MIQSVNKNSNCTSIKRNNKKELRNLRDRCIHFGGAVLNKQKKYGFSIIDVKIFLQM